MLVSYSHIKRGALITVVFSLTSGLMRGLNFLFLPYCMTLLSLSDFGVWDFYQMLFVRISIVLTALGVCSLQRFYFMYQDDRTKQKQVIGNSLILLLIPLIMITIVYASIYAFNNFGNPLIHSMSLIAFLYSLFAYLSAYFRIKERIISYLILLLIQNSVATLGTIVGLYYGYGINSFFYATLISLIIIVPWFIYIFFSYFNFSYSLLKEQALYASPLMIYTIFYISFFLVDRIILQWYGAYEVMGIYGILWRFGSIFQMFAMAFVAAWPNMLFSLTNTNDNQEMVRRLIIYSTCFLCFMCLMTVSISHGLFIWYLPPTVHFMIGYLPIFFLALTFFELARLFQTAFLVSKRTIIVPLITVSVLVMQCILFMGYGWMYGTIDLDCFCVINCISCMIYAYAFYYYGQKVQPLVDSHRIARIIFLFILWLIILYGTQLFIKSPLLSLLLGGSWLIVVWYYCIEPDAQQYLKRITSRLLPY